MAVRFATIRHRQRSHGAVIDLDDLDCSRRCCSAAPTGAWLERLHDHCPQILSNLEYRTCYEGGATLPASLGGGGRERPDELGRLVQPTAGKTKSSLYQELQNIQTRQFLDD